MLERYASAASTYARDVDHLFILVAVIVGFWFILAEVVFFWLIFKYRVKDGRPSLHIIGEEHELHRWITIPYFLVILCDIVIIIPTIIFLYNIKQSMPPADRTARVT